MKVAGALLDGMRPAAVLGLEPLDGRTLVDPGPGHHEIRGVGVAFLSVGDRALEDSLEEPRTTTLAEVERRERLVHRQAADQVGDETSLAGGDAGESMGGGVGHGLVPVSEVSDDHRPDLMPSFLFV